MDGAKFAKFCRDTKIVDKKFTATDVDLTYAKAKAKVMNMPQGCRLLISNLGSLPSFGAPSSRSCLGPTHENAFTTPKLIQRLILSAARCLRSGHIGSIRNIQGRSP